MKFLFSVPAFSILLSLELTREKKSSIRGRVGRMLLVVSLVLIPLLLCIGVYSRSQSREPYVYFIKEVPGPDTSSKVELVMMAAVSSTSSNLNALDSDPIGGPINTRSSQLFFKIKYFFDTRCQLSGDMKGDILMVNVSIPRCRMLVMDKQFMERIRRSRVAAAVILDDTPRHNWRVSSPYQSLSLYNTLMHNTFSTLFSEELRSDFVFMVRRDDWIQHDLMLSQAGHKVFISLGSIRCATKR